MKIKRKQVYAIIFVFTICYGIKANWEAGTTLLQTLQQAISPFIAGAALAFIVNIIMSAYERIYSYLCRSTFLLKLKRPICMFLAFLTLLLLLLWLFSIVLPSLISSLSSLMTVDKVAINNAVDYLNDNKYVAQLIDYIGNDQELTSKITEYSQQLLRQIVDVLTGVLSSVGSIASAIINLFMSFIFSIYILSSKEQLGRQFRLLIDTYLKKYSSSIYYVIDIFNQYFHDFIVSETLEAMILGSLTAGGMYLFRFPYAATVGILVAFTALIPIVGAYIGAIVGFILIATQSIQQAFFFLIFLTCLQQFEGNVIYPRVVGGSIGLPSMWVLVAITIGGALWGIIGMLIAVPLAASCYQMLKDNLAKKQKSLES